MIRRFVSWVLEPFTDIMREKEPTTPLPDEELSETQEVSFSPSTSPKPLTFRPKTFDEYIGQARAKEKIKNYIKGTQKRNRIFPHVLIYGKAGCGKTTLAKIIANELGVQLKEAITSNIQDFWELQQRIEEVEGGILFLDEIHGIDRDTAEKIYTIMEDFTFEGEDIDPFTLIGATTELGEILRNRKPFYDRFKIILELENYTVNDMVAIGKQYRQRVFPDEELDEKTYIILAKNSRITPRTIIRLLEATIYFDKDVHNVLKTFGIIKDGYTIKDLEVLEYIGQTDKGVGLQSIASYLDISITNYSYQIEPYLLKNNLLIRTSRGRKITSKGIITIKQLKVIKKKLRI